MFDPYKIQRGLAVFIRLRSLGDTVLMTPGLEVVKRVPGWEAAVVVEEPFDQILNGNPSLDRILALPRQGGKWRNRAGVIRRLRRWRPDLVIDLHGGTTSALMARLSAARLRIGYGQSRSAGSYDLQVPDSTQVWGKPQVHTVEHQLAPLKHLGFPIDPQPSPRVPVSPREREEMGRLLAGKGISGRFALVHPAAAFDTKQWDVARFAQLMQRLDRQGIGLVATAGPGEERLLAQLRGASPHSVCFLDPLPLERFCALASNCELFIGNDTGTTHIAAALGKRVVAIFGSSDSRVWHPWQAEHRLVKADLPCIPCPGYKCHLYEQPRCIRSIGVDAVEEAVREMLWS